jgi:hypothetical protein
MAKHKRVVVDLDAFLKDLQPRALKGLVSAPLGYRTDRLIEAVRTHSPRLGDIGPSELVSALLHATHPNGAALSRMIDSYRGAQVWQTRQSLGETTAQKGKWYVKVRGRGQHS